MELDRSPVLALRKLGGSDKLDFLLQLWDETSKVLSQSCSDQSGEEVVVAFGAEFSIFAHQRLLPLSACCTRQSQSDELGSVSDLADSFRCAENFFGKAFQLTQELCWYQDLNSFRGFDLIGLIVELDNGSEIANTWLEYGMRTL